MTEPSVETITDKVRDILDMDIYCSDEYKKKYYVQNTARKIADLFSTQQAQMREKVITAIYANSDGYSCKDGDRFIELKKRVLNILGGK